MHLPDDAYAIAKIAGIMGVQSYRREYGRAWISAMPTNLEKSHVLPALIRKFHEATASGAPTVTVRGTGTPRREFLHVATSPLVPRLEALGWKPTIGLAEGLASTYRWFLDHQEAGS